MLEIGPENDVRAVIAALKPGDELLLRGGTYRLDRGFRISVNGTAAQPVVIRASGPDAATFHQTNPRHNVIEIKDSSHLQIRGLRFTGGSHGIRLMASNHITIADSEIFETGDVALSANAGGTYRGLRLLRNHIHHTNGSGEGMYLGCHRDACRVVDSLIEGNYVHHTDGPTVTQGDGIEVKEGSYGNVIRNNVIHDTHYPGILVYGTVGNGPANLIENNFICTSRDNGLQAAADAIIRNNVIIGAPVAFQPHERGRPSNIEFSRNTVITSGHALTVRNATGPVTLMNNALYSQQGRAIRLVGSASNLVTLTGNVGSGGVSTSTSGYREHAGGDEAGSTLLGLAELMAARGHDGSFDCARLAGVLLLR